jgi:hypothetical protein
MPRYLLLLGGADLDKRTANPAIAPELYERFASWLSTLQRGDHYVSSNKLDDRTGARLRVRGGEVVEGPFMETKEAVGGVFLIQAASLEQAIGLARTCPVLGLQNGFVEVRLFEEVSRPVAG